jgi:quaternary ammonium compound-resistance protein SugE
MGKSIRGELVNWILLALAGCLECVWAVGLKYTDGFSKPLPSAMTVLAMICSFWLLSIAMKTIPVGTAYAVWTGIGAVGVAIAGIVMFDESRDFARILCIMLIVAGVAGLRFFFR